MLKSPSPARLVRADRNGAKKKDTNKNSRIHNFIITHLAKTSNHIFQSPKRVKNIKCNSHLISRLDKF